ncbi:MAG: hypothetical protein E7192_00805 [Erysipelotrichaceae bacterium]|nr:hypothetical protein [Erysipelotrichaceae bacterium]
MMFSKIIYFQSIRVDEMNIIAPVLMINVDVQKTVFFKMVIIDSRIEQ